MSNSHHRNNYNKNVKICYKKCFISGVTAPQAEYAHIIPLNTCINLGYEKHSESAHNSLILSKNLHGTFELENNIPTYSFLRIDDKIGKKTTKFKLVILSKPNYLEEQEYEDQIFEIDSFKVPYLDLHYKICCYLHKINDQKISLLSVNREFFIIFNKYKKYYEEKPTVIQPARKKRPICEITDGCLDRDDDQWKVKKILKHRFDRIREQNIYLIKWDGKKKNGRSWSDSWHAEEDISSCLVEEYLKTLITT